MLGCVVVLTSKATLKKSLFPVQRVAEIVASRVAVKKKIIPFFFGGWGGGGARK